VEVPGWIGGFLLSEIVDCGEGGRGAEAEFEVRGHRVRAGAVNARPDEMEKRFDLVQDGAALTAELKEVREKIALKY